MLQAAVSHYDLPRKLTLGMRASKLIHEIGNHSVEVDAIVETRVGKIDKVSAGNGHLLNVQLQAQANENGVSVSWS